MPLDDRINTLVRGADGVLYEVSDDASKPISAVRDDAFASDATPSDRVMVGHSDHIAARVLIDPSDHASARVLIDPGDHEASRVLIDPGDHDASRVLIQPANA